MSEEQKKLFKRVPAFLIPMLVALATTNSGWIKRQILRLVTVMTGSLTGWLVAQGVDHSFIEILATAAAAGVLLALDMFISRVSTYFEIQDAKRVVDVKAILEEVKAGKHQKPDAGVDPER